jgi:hypothetical protein
MKQLDISYKVYLKLLAQEIQKHLVAYFGCKNHIEIIRLLEQLWEEGNIKMILPDSKAIFPKMHFDVFQACLTKTGLLKIEEIKKKNSPIDYKIKNISVESILNQIETSKIEVKGSCKLDLNRYLKGDNKTEFKNEIALEGFLKEIVALLNTNGGTILIGAVETKFYSEEQISKLEHKTIGAYYLIGIKIENDDLDIYLQTIINLISSHIAKDLVDLIEITLPEYNGFTFCKIIINRASYKWYYLGKEKLFYVRNGNKTEILYGEDADNYKKRNPR